MSEPIAMTECGRVRGRTEAPGIVAFRGIPYAMPPDRQRRWKPSQRPHKWDGIRDARTFGPMCPQPPAVGLVAEILPTEAESEDCLYCNVWTPGLDDAGRPVAVWIHGGGFMQGSGSWPSGDAFARDGVVLVSFNYRLGTFGFLYLDELFEGFEGTGNLGIYDQIAALQWVRENIRAFGGDPANVTIFGESAGAISVGTLLGTPAAHGLFRRAISQSGAAHHARSARAATQVARHACEILGIEPGDTEALSSLTADRLKTATALLAGEALEIADMLEDEDPLGGNMPFSPVVDGKLLDRRPIESVRAGSGAGVDLLVGTCEDEWRLVMFAQGPEAAAATPPPDLDRMRAGTDRTGKDLLAAYRAVRPGRTDRELYCDILTDLVFAVPALRLADAQTTHASVYRYVFGWRTPVLDGVLGACHALEIPFVFDRLGDAVPLVGDAPQALADSVHTAWVNFIKAGRPEAPGLPKWPTYDRERRPTVRLDLESTVELDPDQERVALWPHW